MKDRTILPPRQEVPILQRLTIPALSLLRPMCPRGTPSLKSCCNAVLRRTQMIGSIHQAQSMR